MRVGLKKSMFLLVALALMLTVFSVDVFATEGDFPTVVSIEVVEGDMVTDGTGEFRTVIYAPNTGAATPCDGHYYYYYGADDVNIKMEFSDGTIAYTEGKGYIMLSDNQNNKRFYYIKASTEQGENGFQWSVGGENTVAFECEGVTCAYNVTMLESPVESIEVCEYKTLIENTDGVYADTVYNPETGEDESCEPYYSYPCDYSLVNLRITYKNGTVVYSRFGSGISTGEYDYRSIYVSDAVGKPYDRKCNVNGEKQITYMFMGKTCTFDVKIAPQTENVLNPIPGSFYDYDKVIWGVYARGEDGTSRLQTDYNGLIENDFGKWYAVDGVVDFTYHTVVKDPTHGWVAVYRNRYFNTEYTGILGNEYGWWRVVDGKVDFNATGVYENMYGWWYCEDGKVRFDYTGIRKNDNGWWRIESGKVNFSATGVYQNELGWWYCQNGKVQFNYTGIKNNANGWWRIENGRVNFSANGVYQNENGWWKVENGKVNFGFTGIAQNSNGKWYCKDGKVDFSKNGRVYYSGKYYTVKGGKVV